MTLHEAIIKVLQEYGSPMKTSEIADILNGNKWYEKKDKSLIDSSQISLRTKNYPQFFERNGSSVSLKNGNSSIASNVFNEKVSLLARTAVECKIKTESSEFDEDSFMDESKFVLAGSLSHENVPALPGLYCIRLMPNSVLPKPFATELLERGHNILYIGIASKSLQHRFLEQELRANGHGTFFRSIGALFGFRPPKGSLVGKKNQNNYKFSPSNEKKIIEWINVHLMVHYSLYKGNCEDVENVLIPKYLPLLNLAKNPAAMSELTALRNECKRIAREL